MTMTRRDLLITLGAGAMTPLLAHAGPPALPRPSRADASDPRATSSALRAAPVGVGVQCYMLRAQMAADPEATLAHVAHIGYGELEWWGSWKRTPAQLRATLDANGLRAPSAHVGTPSLRPDRIDALLETAATMGHANVVVASTSKEERENLEAVQRTAALLNQAGESARKAGVRIGYHNHDAEWALVGDRPVFEVLVAETDPALVDFELDCYWAFKAGQDPLALLGRHGDRISLLHLKDSTGGPERAQVDVGAGVIDWRAIIALGVRQRVSHLFLDQDDPADPWASAGTARAYLRTLGY